MNLIKSIYYAWRRSKMKREALYGLSKKTFEDPKEYMKAIKAIHCIIYGHRWSSEFNPKEEITKPITKRVYCKDCGLYYNANAYKEVK